MIKYPINKKLEILDSEYTQIQIGVMEISYELAYERFHVEVSLPFKISGENEVQEEVVVVEVFNEDYETIYDCAYKVYEEIVSVIESYDDEETTPTIEEYSEIVDSIENGLQKFITKVEAQEITAGESIDKNIRVGTESVLTSFEFTVYAVTRGVQLSERDKDGAPLNLELNVMVYMGDALLEDPLYITTSGISEALRKMERGLVQVVMELARENGYKGEIEFGLNEAEELIDEVSDLF